MELDEEKRTKWAGIAENLAPYPKGTIREIRGQSYIVEKRDVKLERISQEMLDKKFIMMRVLAESGPSIFLKYNYIFIQGMVGLEVIKRAGSGEKAKAYSQPGGEQAGRAGV